jgi:hypothetical protein
MAPLGTPHCHSSEVWLLLVPVGRAHILRNFRVKCAEWTIFVGERSQATRKRVRNNYHIPYPAMTERTDRLTTYSIIN